MERIRFNETAFGMVIASDTGVEKLEVADPVEWGLKERRVAMFEARGANMQ
jgi:hypothetical protein